MKRKNKLFSSLLVTGILLSTGGNVYAADMNSEGNATINWDQMWNDLDSGNSLGEQIDFGSSNAGTGIGISAYGDLASGSTALSSASGEVTSTGKTTGKTLTTTISATTSLRISGMGYITGPKKIALGKFTATSTIATTNPSSLQSFEALTIHTATNSGVLYEARTADSGSY